MSESRGRLLLTQQATNKRLLQLAALWLRGLAIVAGVVFTGIISIALGFNPLPGEIPLMAWIRTNSLVAILGAGGVLVITISSLFLQRLSRTPAADTNAGDPLAGADKHVRRLVTATGFSTLSTAALLCLVTVMLLRPPWCPISLCLPAPARAVSTVTGGSHDQNLDVYLVAAQSAYYVLPDAPSSYSLANLPRVIGAARTDQKGGPPFQVVIGVHNLQQNGFGIIIERVDVRVEQLLPLPSPLNVWLAGTALAYGNNPYALPYAGQRPGALLSAVYQPNPLLHPQLRPGEADTLAIQFMSKVSADMRFRVGITYRVANESQARTLTLSSDLEAAFSDANNWHPYVVQDGYLVPQA